MSRDSAIQGLQLKGVRLSHAARAALARSARVVSDVHPNVGESERYGSNKLTLTTKHGERPLWDVDLVSVPVGLVAVVVDGVTAIRFTIEQPFDGETEADLEAKALLVPCPVKVGTHYVCGLAIAPDSGRRRRCLANHLVDLAQDHRSAEAIDASAPTSHLPIHRANPNARVLPLAFFSSVCEENMVILRETFPDGRLVMSEEFGPILSAAGAELMLSVAFMRRRDRMPLLERWYAEACTIRGLDKRPLSDEEKTTHDAQMASFGEDARDSAFWVNLKTFLRWCQDQHIEHGGRSADDIRVEYDLEAWRVCCNQSAPREISTYFEESSR